ncbi:MAG: hypothetical protein ACEPOZ_21285 [Marinifilaceae bacterium]
MYRSKEIRWFTQEENKRICNWFAKQKLDFNTITARTDYYLVALDNEHTIPKLREGRVEIKYRVGIPRIHQLSPNAEGYFEEFVKWSFQLDAGDALAEEIIDWNQYATEWVEVVKQRLGLKLSKGNKGTLEIHDIKECIASGCQIEYTRIRVKNQTWYSFNLEWFGAEFINLDPSFISEIVGASVLRLKDSMSYGGFMKRVKR